MNTLIYTLIIISIILQMLGGLSDIKDKKLTIMGMTVSKEHLWVDALYLLTLAIALKVMFKKS